MIEDIKEGNGLAYSIIITGKEPGSKAEEIIGYIIAVEDETDEGDACVYLEDIAVAPEAQGQGVGWEMLKNFIDKLKEKARRDNKPVLLDMHLRENSQRFMERPSRRFGTNGCEAH
ncbi:MAG TPA: GNAT family N-acetyltransferase [Candidatus Paceibacterota bacterium]